MGECIIVLDRVVLFDEIRNSFGRLFVGLDVIMLGIVTCCFCGQDKHIVERACELGVLDSWFLNN